MVVMLAGTRISNLELHQWERRVCAFRSNPSVHSPRPNSASPVVEGRRRPTVCLAEAINPVSRCCTLLVWLVEMYEMSLYVQDRFQILRCH